jgi:hypothetical protein
MFLFWKDTVNIVEKQEKRTSTCRDTRDNGDISAAKQAKKNNNKKPPKSFLTPWLPAC